jgi:hypothetical protein
LETGPPARSREWDDVRVDLSDEAVPEREQIAVGESEASGLAVVTNALAGDDYDVAGLDGSLDSELRAIEYFFSPS